MKKRINHLLALLILIFFVPIVSTVTGEIITSETITGEVSAQITNVSIQVLAAVSSLNIISPKNGTYLKNISLLLNYTVSNEQAVWYNLDKGTNITITGATYFNTSQGNHTLYLYANNTDNNITTTNVTFIVNLTLFTILYLEYNGSLRGASTDFITYTYEDLQNLSNIILENTEYGKILFNEAINLTDDEDFSDKILDLDSYTNISFNRIELNSSALPNFNKSATLWLYNLTFSNPRILRDGSVCPSTICTRESYSGGTLKTLKFNVTQFTIYSAEETPSEVSPPPPSPPGGGGTSTIKRGFSTDREDISVSLKQGESKEEIIVIRNIGDTLLKINLESSGLENFLKINETNFSLNPGRSRTIVLNFSASEDAIPDLYIGKLIIKGNGITKELFVVIEVESKEYLFDAKVEIPEKYLYVLPGEDLLANIEIFSLGEPGRVDVDVDYIIKDKNGNEVFSESEIVTVENQTTYTKSFKIPEEVEFGKYVFYIKITYKEGIASASALFNVGKIPSIPFKKGIITLLILLLIAIIIIVYKIIKKKKDSKKLKKPKISKKSLKRAKIIKR